MFDDNSENKNTEGQPQEKIEPTISSPAPEEYSNPAMNPAEQYNTPPESTENPQSYSEQSANNQASADSFEQNNTTQQQPTQPSQDEKKEEEAAPEVTNDISAVASSKAKGILVTVGMVIAFIFLLKNVYTTFREDEHADDMQTEDVLMPDQVTTPSALQSGDLADQSQIVMPNVNDVLAPDSAPKAPAPTSLPGDTAEDSATDSKKDLPSVPALPGEDTAQSASADATPALPGMPATPDALPGIPTVPGAAPMPGSDESNTSSVGPSLFGIEEPNENVKKKKRRDAKRRSSIVLIGGTAPKSVEEIQQSQDFVKRGNSDYLLARGKVLDAILETAINTNFGGEVRAVISRDVYSSSGRAILIPKGSRVFGAYTNTVDQTYGKIEIMWSRIDLPSGYSLNISAPAVDHLGRPGIIGRLDNKQMEKIGQAVMASALNVVLAGVVDKLVKPPENVTASNQNSETINTIRSISNAVAYDASISNPQQKMLQICSQLRTALTDKTSSAYTQLDSQCTSAQANSDWQDTSKNNQLLQNFILSLNSITDSVTQSAAQAQIASKEQDAAKQGFEDVSQAIKDSLTSEQTFKPVITVDQGKAIKIYMTKDYTFPKKAVKKSRIVR